jgi:hypothetical protein
MGGYQSFGEPHRYHFKKYVLISGLKVGLETDVSKIEQAEGLENFVHLIVIEVGQVAQSV